MINQRVFMRVALNLVFTFSNSSYRSILMGDLENAKVKVIAAVKFSKFVKKNVLVAIFV